MPRPALPPTPASSTDLKGQEQQNANSSAQFQTFELPPPAMTGDSGPRTASLDNAMSSKSSYPVQPSETAKSRRRSSAAQPPKTSQDSFALPPPPTRSRKIIQMKPRQEENTTPPAVAPASKPAASKKGSGSGSGVTSEAGSSGAGKKKQAGATTAAGRKIARKTAHSLIERRRRSKMNEEFAVLKGLIPACTGEMHKLAILQASIEYVRYLEDCIKQLKANQQTTQQGTPTQPPTPTAHDFSHSPNVGTASQEQPFVPRAYTDASGDVEMTGSEGPSPYTSTASSVHQPSVSPALMAEDNRRRHDSYSSITHDQRHYSYSNSTATSPAFGPQPSSYGTSYGAGSSLTSPALAPQRDRDRDLDHEATTALLMLNKDPRALPPIQTGPPAPPPSAGSSYTPSQRAKRMSVKDLLSS